MKLVLGSIAIALFICTAALPVYSAVSETKPSDTTTITPDAIALALSDELEKQGAGKDVDVKLVGANRDAAYTYSTPISMHIDALTIDAKAGIFSATLNFESEGAPLAPAKVSGRYEEMVLVPTLKRRLFQGDVISQDDIEMDRIASSRLRKGTVLQAESVIGRSPVKVISANRPILATEISSPFIVSKGEQITIRYDSANLSINTLAEALDSGAAGDKIRVKNLSSNKVLQAEIKNKNLAIVHNMIDTSSDKE